MLRRASCARGELEHLELYLWQQCLKALAEVNLLLTGAKAALIEHHPQWRLWQGCYRLDEAHIDVIGKASQELTMSVNIGGVASKIYSGKGAIKRQTVIKETAKEQVEVAAIGLKSRVKLREQILFIFADGVAGVFVGRVDLEDAEA